MTSVNLLKHQKSNDDFSDTDFDRMPSQASDKIFMHILLCPHIRFILSFVLSFSILVGEIAEKREVLNL
jgi:hypothetical protein